MPTLLPVSFTHRGINTKRPTLVFFLVPTKPLHNHMDRQARTHDTVFVKNREMTGRRRGKDDRKQNT
jgi:hypothetical protein